ncbi:MAG: exo-alpha-sialidase [Clostridia bacterium]|nr:exo-alpha-sialidase [Clostridia bacterium]
MKHITMIEKDGMFGYFAWPSVARLKDGRLVAVCSGFRMTHVCPFGKVAVTVSEDDGATWSEPKVLFETPLDDRDGGITPWGDGFILTTFNNTRAFQRARNETRPFSDPEKNALVQEQIARVSDAEEDEHWGSHYVCYDKNLKELYRGKLPLTAPHGFTLLNDGTLFLVGRRFYATNTPNALFSSYPKEGIGFITSADGKNFSDVTWLELPEKELSEGSLFCEPHAVQLKNGRILIQIRLQNSNTHLNNTNGLFTIYQCHSDDNGKTFTVPAPLCTPEGGMCGSPPHLIEMPTGEVVTVYGYRNQPYGQRARVSFDHGDTWSREIVLRDDGPTGDLGYPASVIVGDDLLTVYYQKRDKDAPCGIYATLWNYHEFL